MLYSTYLPTLLLLEMGTLLRNHVIFETGLPVAMQSMIIGRGTAIVSSAASIIVTTGEARRGSKIKDSDKLKPTS